jgi:hypothetical protein
VGVFTARHTAKARGEAGVIPGYPIRSTLARTKRLNHARLKLTIWERARVVDQWPVLVPATLNTKAINNGMTPKIRQLKVSARVKTNQDTLPCFRRGGFTIETGGGDTAASEEKLPSSVL